MIGSSIIAARMRFAFALFVAAASGFVSLSYELVWYRAWAFVSQASPAAFGLLLGAYLTGIAVGSLASERFCKDGEATFSPAVLRWLALFVFAANVVAYLVVPGLGFYTATTYYWRGALVLVGVATALLGVTLPLVAHFGIAGDDRAGARVSYLYLANIFGSVAGSLFTGFWLFDHLGVAAIAALLGVIGTALALIVALASSPPAGLRLGAIGAALAAAIGIATSREALHRELYEKLLWGKDFRTYGPFTDVVENRHGVITVAKDGHVYGGGAYDGIFNVGLLDDQNWIARAYGVAGMHPAPKNVLMIGLASGSWAQILVNMPGLEKLTVVEINDGYLPLIAKRDSVRSILANPKMELVIDDGRRWLQRHPDQRFDFIVMNTTYHYRSNATNLLSRDFLELARPHLQPGGILFYNTTGSGDVVKTGITTYPYALRFYNFLAVSDAPFTLDRDRFERALLAWRIDGRPVLDPSREDHRRRLGELLALPETMSAPPIEGGLETRESMLVSYASDQVITDDNMRSEWFSKDAP